MSGPSDPLTNSSGLPKTPGTTSVSSLFTWLGTRGDYSSIRRRDAELKGWRRQISTVTKEGRFNLVVATYITTALAGFYLWKTYKQSKTDSAVTDSAAVASSR